MAQKPTFDYDVIIIGSGAGGSPAATVLARAGKKVAIIERGVFGGESPNWGDIPTGALLYTADVYHEAKTAAKFGLRTSTVGYNYPSLLAWKDTAIRRTGTGGNRSYYEKQGISVFTGSAHFLSPNEITVSRRHLSARKFLIASGSTWRDDHIPGLDEVAHHTPQTILSLKRPPKTLFVVGSGTTAMELAYLFSTFGSKVYVAETAGRILPEFDQEVGELIAADAKAQRGMNILTQTKLVAIQKDGIAKRVTYARGGQQHSVRVDELLITDDRLPTTDIGLENAGVAYTEHGIQVSEAMQTSARHIFAAGSVVDLQAQTHTILSHSRTAAHNLLHHNFIALDDTPRLTIAFTDPQIARTGLDEDDCLRRDLKINVALAPLTLTARSNITDRRSGFVKLISDKKGVLLGATIVAPGASDLMTGLSLAIRHGLTAKQLMSTPNCFVAWSEAVRIAAGKLAAD
jgi:pyridine nucleotide-disulphide oxidoreductase dimerisation region